MIGNARRYGMCRDKHAVAVDAIGILQTQSAHALMGSDTRNDFNEASH